MGFLQTILGRKSASASSVTDLYGQSSYPVWSAQQLISALGQDNRLRSIRRLVGIDHDTFDLLYQPALDAFVVGAQLQPGSTVDHHSGLGGLIVHTLEVVEFALRERKQYLLPQNSAPEVIQREQHCWTYGVFAAALLHDSGKLLTLTRLKLDDGKYWTPLGPSLLETGANEYRIEYINAPYALQTRVSSMLFAFIPPIGRDMIAQNQAVLAQLTAWLNDDSYEWGIIGEMVRKSDSKSVANNLKTGANRPLPNAPGKPMVDRLTRALRAVIYDGEIRFNRSGEAGWTDGHFVYLVCKIAAEKARARMQEEGSSDIPTDNNRLYDLWQDNMYLHPTPDGKAIWKVRITGPDQEFSHVLTVLKFDASRLIHPSKRVQPFAGKIAVASESEPETALPQTEPVSDAGTDRAPRSEGSATGETGAVEAAKTLAAQVTQTHTTTRPGNAEHADSTSTEGSIEENGSTCRTEATPDTAAPMNPLDALLAQRATQPTIDRPKTGPASRQGKAHGKPSHGNTPERAEDALTRAATAHHEPTTDVVVRPVPLEHDDIQDFFIAWIQQGVRSGSLKVNDPTASVHVLPDAVALVSPKIYRKFLVDNKLTPNEDNDAIMAATKRLQNRIRRRKLNLVAESGYSIFCLQVETASTSARLNAFLFPTELIYGDMTPPEPNPICKRMSKFKGE